MSDKFLTCFVPETCGSLIHGLEFHKFYFDNGNKLSTEHSTQLSTSSRIIIVPLRIFVPSIKIKRFVFLWSAMAYRGPLLGTNSASHIIIPSIQLGSPGVPGML